MSSPSGGGFVENVGRSVEYGFRDVGLGLEQIGQGQVARGVGTLSRGVPAASLSPLSMQAGGLGLLPPGASQQRDIEIQAGEVAEAERTSNIAFENRRRQQGINTLLDELIRLRTRAPGRQQTLLTSGIVPNPQYTGTLLTRSR